MVFKLLIAVAILLLHTSVCDAQNPSHRVSLDHTDKWDLYGNDLFTLVYKRIPNLSQGERAKPGCVNGGAEVVCQIDETVEPKPEHKLTTKPKRTWEKLDLMKLLSLLSRGETPESESFESNDYETRPDK